MRIYTDEERIKFNDPLKCYDCGLEYGTFPDFVIPDVLWERINPTYHEGSGILCPTCIAKRLDELDLWYDFTEAMRGQYISQDKCPFWR